MDDRNRIPDASRPAAVTDRRGFLHSAIGFGAGVLLSDLALGADDHSRPRTNQPPGVPRSTRSRVVSTRSKYILSLQTVSPAMFRSCLKTGMCALTDRARLADAWHALLRPHDAILLKFNQSASERIGTSIVAAEEIVSSLMDAGWAPERITVLEAPRSGEMVRRTRRPDLRWPQHETRFATVGSDAFLAAVEESTAIINVPFLKTHHRATMTGCLKNLSHGLIRHPGRFHDNGCDPAIAEIVASPPVRSRLRLNIVNALRCVFDHGPEARSEDIHEAGVLLFSQDPVAADAMGFAILNEVRALRRMGPVLPSAQVPPQLLTAARIRLGNVDPDSFDTLALEV